MFSVGTLAQNYTPRKPKLMRCDAKIYVQAAEGMNFNLAALFFAYMTIKWQTLS
jgi:hypothetical protein